MHFYRRPSLRKVSAAAALVIALGLSTAPLALAERKLSGAVTLSSKDRVSVVLDRETADDGSYVVLKIVTPQDVKIDAFMLPSPPRIVLDLTGASVKRSETFNAPTNDVVKAVRLGSHPGKLRVVVDLVKEEAPKYDWKAGKRQVILRMLEKAAPAAAAAAPEAVQPPAQPATEAPQVPAEKAVEPAAEEPKLPEDAGEAGAISLGETEQQAKDDAPQAAPAEKAVEAALPAQEPEKPAQAPQEEKIAPTAVAQEPTLAPTTAPPAEQPGSLGAAAAAAPQATTPPTAQGDIKVIGYRFEYGEPGKTPILKVTLNSNGASAQISKVDSTTYKIVVPKSALANEELVLPQFPPADFVGFIMVMSEEVSGSVEITVSVEEGVTLNTMVKGDEIWALASGT